MKLSGNTVLITGGVSGIGLELATQLMSLGNTVIVTGRSQSHLDAAKRQLPGVHAIQSDVGDPAAIAALHRRIVAEFPSLNMLINNAGIMRQINLNTFGSDLQDITREVDVDLSGPIRMTLQFLPQLKSQQRAVIVNVSSGLAFVPLATSPVYCAAKAAIHSFTQSLRIQLKNTSVAVFEVAPPITATPLFAGGINIDDIGVKPMQVKELVTAIVAGIERDRLEIRPGLSNALKFMSRVAPSFILNRLNKSAGRILAR
jgi:uncharacterized oxidoreductase